MKKTVKVILWVLLALIVIAAAGISVFTGDQVVKNSTRLSEAVDKIEIWAKDAYEKQAEADDLDEDAWEEIDGDDDFFSDDEEEPGATEGRASDGI